MRKIKFFKGRRASLGSSLVELALVLPVILILVLAVIDFGRAILFNNILVNMGREGANLAARTTQTSPFIIKALDDTSAPLDITTNGRFFIFRITGVTVGGVVRARVDELYRSTSGNASLTSKYLACPGSWDSSTGLCNLPALPGGQTARLIPTGVWTLPLADGEQVRVAEGMYHYLPLTTNLMGAAIDLYSATLL